MPTVANWIDQLNKKPKEEDNSDDDDSEDEDWVPTEDKKSSNCDDNPIKKGEVEIATEPDPVEAEAKQEDDRKRKADLWSSFLKDVKGPKPKVAKLSSTSEVGQKNSDDGTSKIEKSANDLSNVTNLLPEVGSTDEGKLNTTFEKCSSKSMVPEWVEVKRVYDFAGEEIVVTEKVASTSKQASQSDVSENQDKQQTEQQSTDNNQSLSETCSTSDTSQTQDGGSQNVSSSSITNPKIGVPKIGIEGSRLGSIVGSLGKKKKMGTLQKSALDWESFKTSQGEDLTEELSAHRRSKNSFLDRQDFLHRVDWAQFEIERDVRSKEKKRTGQN